MSEAMSPWMSNTEAASPRPGAADDREPGPATPHRPPAAAPAPSCALQTTTPRAIGGVRAGLQPCHWKELADHSAEGLRSRARPQFAISSSWCCSAHSKSICALFLYCVRVGNVVRASIGVNVASPGVRCGGLLEQILVCAGALQIEHLSLDTVDERPVRLDVALARPSPLALLLVVPMTGIERLASNRRSSTEWSFAASLPRRSIRRKSRLNAAVNSGRRITRAAYGTAPPGHRLGSGRFQPGSPSTPAWFRR